MRGLAIAGLVTAALLVACAEPPAQQVRATFVPGSGAAQPPTASVPGRLQATPGAACDLQNSTLQDSGLPVLLVEPLSPRPGETVTVTGERLPPGPRRLTLMTPLQRDEEFDVTVGLDGRLRATFAMPPVVAGQCAMLVLDGLGVQSLGFALGE
jgi:hypothetical protein